MRIAPLPGLGGPVHTVRVRSTRARRPVRANPVSDTARYHHYSARPATQFSSFKTITLAQAIRSYPGDAGDVVKRIRARKHGGGTPSGSRPALGRTWREGVKVRVGKFKASVKRGRPKGKRGDPLAWGIQSILVPKPAKARKAAKARKPAKATKARRKNPGRLMVMNPLPPHIEKFRNGLSPAERPQFDQALRRYIKFHGGAYPTKITKVGQQPGKHRQFLVGMGRAVDVGYSANKGYKGSNKRGTPWRHEFRANAQMATTPNGKQILVLNKPGARSGFKVTDWVRG